MWDTEKCEGKVKRAVCGSVTRETKTPGDTNRPANTSTQCSGAHPRRWTPSLRSTVRWVTWPWGWWRTAESWGLKPGSSHSCGGEQGQESVRVHAAGARLHWCGDVSPGEGWCCVSVWRHIKHKSAVNFGSMSVWGCTGGGWAYTHSHTQRDNRLG